MTGRAVMRERVARYGWMPPTLVAVLLVAFSAFAALTRPPWVSSTALDRWWLPTAGNWVMALVIAVAACTGFAAYVLPRWKRYRRERGRSVPAPVFIAIAVLSSTAFVLGFAAYLPCDTVGVRGLGALTWTATLFVGALEPGVIGPDTVGVCGGELPLAMQLARFASICAIFITALAALFAASREVLALWRVKRAGDVDLVVGLDAVSIPLVRALVAESEFRTRDDEFTSRPPWYSPGSWGSARPKVVVIHPVRNDTLAAEAIDAGGTVITGEPSELLQGSLLVGGGRFGARRRRVVSFRRAFFVSADQEANLRLLAQAEALLRDAEPSPHETVPRVVVRLDDAREARAWRLRAMTRAEASPDSPSPHRSWFVDGITSDGVLAEVLAVELADEKKVRIGIVGDTPLAIRLVEELSWRAWKTTRIKTYIDGEWTDRPAVEQVVLVGAGAARMQGEWNRTRPPSSVGEHAPTITADDGADWESRIRELLDAGKVDAIVVTTHDAPSVAAAPRLARLYPTVPVFAFDPLIQGVSEMIRRGSDRGWSAASPVPAVVRFGPTLLDGEHVPEDSWTKLARFQHLRWTASKEYLEGDASTVTSQPASSRPWGGRGDDDPRMRKTVDVDADPTLRLPDFYREDNLRQQRRLITNVTRQWGGRFEWEPVVSGSYVAPLHASEVLELARREHERWTRYRQGAGWSGLDVGVAPPHPGKSLDQQHLNKNLADWDTGEPLADGRLRGEETDARVADRRAAAVARRLGNVEGVLGILDALQNWGIAPSRREDAAALEPADAVIAGRLVSGRARTGPQVEVPAGHWLVLEMTGAQHALSPEQFAARYLKVEGDIHVAAPEAQRFRRIGQARARRLDREVSWTTDGGDVLTSPAGDWWVTTADGIERGVAAAEFPRLYEQVSADGYRRRGTVMAFRAPARVELDTLEGIAFARPGDWIIIDGDDRWPVTPDVFDGLYVADAEHPAD